RLRVVRSAPSRATPPSLRARGRRASLYIERVFRARSSQGEFFGDPAPDSGKHRMIDGVAHCVAGKAQPFSEPGNGHPLSEESGLYPKREIILPVSLLWFTSVHRQLTTRLEQALNPST